MYTPPIMPNGHGTRPFFSRTDAFMLARPNERGKLAVAGHETGKRRVVTCYLSPAHAVIEAVRRRQRGEIFDVVHAWHVEQEVFRDAHAVDASQVDDRCAA
jgi:hypothetical protein